MSYLVENTMDYSKTTLAIVNFEINRLGSKKEAIERRLVELYEIKNLVEDKICEEESYLHKEHRCCHD